MEEHEHLGDSNLADFYFAAEDYDQVGEEELAPSLHAISNVSDRYQSSEFIAEGGMKRVFKVHDARCKRDVAMATLHDDAPIELADPLIHEAWLTAQLDHPNIITIHDVGVDSSNRPFFTMDLKTGESLERVLELLRGEDGASQARFTFTDLLQMFIKICDAMDYAHSIRVLHLDLKPANIQVGRYGEVLVCDWGLGRVLKQDDGIEFERLLLNSDLLSSNTLFGEMRGTPGYMAPEQTDRDADRDVRTDIYQLGCILYSILTLQRPIDHDPSDSIEPLTSRSIKPPRVRAPERNIPASLEAVALKAMQLAPDQRYQDVASLSEEVRRYLTGFATQAEDAGVLTQATLFYKRNKRLCLIVLGCAVLLFGGAVWSYWSLAEKERAATSARKNAEQTLKLYEAGINARLKLSSQNAESVERAVVEMHLNAESDRPGQLLLAALEAEPDNLIYLRAIGEHYFIAQRFRQASGYLDRGEKRSEWPDQTIANLAREFAALKSDDQMLTKDQMVALLQQIDGFDGFEAMIILHDQKYRKNPMEKAEIIREHLRSINPQWADEEFEYDLKSNRLRVGGLGLKRLSDSRSVISGLEIKSLDVSGSEIRHLWQERGNAIERLDVRGCPIDDPYFLERFVYLKKLVVSPGKFKPQELDFLPDWVDVIEQELERK